MRTATRATSQESKYRQNGNRKLKVKLKVPGRKKNTETQSEGAVFDLTGGSTVTAAIKPAADASFGLTDNVADEFSVSVRNAEPLIKRLDTEKKGVSWIKSLQLNLASAAIVMAMMALLFTAADLPELIFFIVPGFLVFMLITMLDAFEGDKIRRIRWYIAAVIGVALIATMIVFRSYIGNGWAVIMDHLYDNAEIAQAYIYDRFHIGSLGEEHPYRCMHFAAIWGSCLVGLIAALPPVRFRRTVAMLAAGFSMMAFAYYGLIPSWICIAVILAALIFLLSDGSIMSSLAVFVAVAIVFGAVTLIDPGESYSISRMDEKFRDRFALRSSYLDSGDTALDDLSEMEEMMHDQQDQQDSTGSEFLAEHRWIATLIVLLVVLAVIGTVVWLLMKRLRKRQRENRAGIDSSDPRTAIVAMFPYTVKWLQPAGIEPAGKAFESLVPAIRADVSEQYAERYTDMYELWKEAAYSDHEMTEDRRNEMKSFLGDTMDMIREKSDIKTRLVNTFRYAL